MRFSYIKKISFLVMLLTLFYHADAFAAPMMKFEIDSNETTQISTALKFILTLTAISLLPSALLATTSFVRIVIVLTFLRNALGAQNMPPTQVIMGLALFLTIAIMTPVGTKIYQDALEPYLENNMKVTEAIDHASAPLRVFMLKQTRPSDLALFYNIAKTDRPKTRDAVKMNLLIPAFIISELRTSFEMGFLIYLPFLLIDLIVASILMGMGMVMVPPAMIGLPIKIMLFVLADGWNLIIGSLVRSFA